jgi:hypothetical protein
MTTDQNPDFDGCNSECRKAGKHSLRWGGCEQATPPEPTVSMSVVYTDHDGGPSIGFDTYTVPELARLIEPVLGDPLKAAAAARRIVHRHDEQQAAVPSAAVPPTQAALRNRIRRAVCEAEGFGWDTDMLEPDEYGEVADAVLAVLPAPVDRAAVLREAADAAEDVAESLRKHHEFERSTGALDVMTELRRLAEAPQPETQAGPVEQPPVCEGFQWIGQSFATCDRCGHPAWDHQGEDVAAEGAGPFDGRRTVRLWEPGEADRIRAKWGAPAVVAQPICKCPAELCHCDHGAVVAQPGKEG